MADMTPDARAYLYKAVKHYHDYWHGGLIDRCPEDVCKSNVAALATRPSFICCGNSVNGGGMHAPNCAVAFARHDARVRPEDIPEGDRVGISIDDLLMELGSEG